MLSDPPWPRDLPLREGPRPGPRSSLTGPEARTQSGAGALDQDGGPLPSLRGSPCNGAGEARDVMSLCHVVRQRGVMDVERHVCADEGAQPGESLRAAEKEDDALCPPHIHGSAGGR